MQRVFHNTDIKSKLSAVMLFCILGGAGLANAIVPGYLEVGMFSAAEVTESLPVGWEPLTFSEIDRHTHYSLVNAGDKVVVKAVSNQSASGLTRAVTIAPVEYPILKWRWKVDNILQTGDVTTKDGDDYPARIYITFTLDPDRVGYFERLRHVAATAVFGPDVPYRAISYIWGQ